MSEIKKKEYLIDNAYLMSEWDWDKNTDIGLDPTTLTLGSNKRAWWICKEKHSWKETIVNRSHNAKCPYCQNRRLLVGYNDLETKCPELAKEWDYEKNGELLPSQISYRSGRIVYWKCGYCGNVWQEKIGDRTQREVGCPTCRKKKNTEKRLKTILNKAGGIKDDRLLSEWNWEKNAPFHPSDFTEGSNKKVWWKCKKCGHEWEAKICNRKNDRGCPCCSNKVVVAGKNDLATTHPQLIKEWNWEKNNKLGIYPTNITRGSGKKAWWICPNGHEYLATVLHRTQGTGCPVCNKGRQTSFAEQAIFYYLQKYYSDTQNKVQNIYGTRLEFDIYIPSIRTAIEYDGGYWHEKEKSILHEQKKYNLCKKEGITLIRIREPFDKKINESNYLWISRSVPNNTFNADYLIQADKTGRNKDLDKVLNTLFVILRQIEMWFHPFKEWKDIDINIERDKEYIYTKLYDNYSESLQVVNPELAKEWHPTKNNDLTPNRVSYNTRMKVWWLCPKCGYEWKTSIVLRNNNGSGCPKCASLRMVGTGRTIYQYSKDGVFIKKWNCISTASKELGIHSSNMAGCARHVTRTAGGYRWEFEYSDVLPPLEPLKRPNKTSNGKKIIQCNEKGEEIKMFESLSQASRELKINATSISKAINGHIRSAGGYIWKSFKE